MSRFHMSFQILFSFVFGLANLTMVQIPHELENLFKDDSNFVPQDSLSFGGKVSSRGGGLELVRRRSELWFEKGSRRCARRSRSTRGCYSRRGSRVCTAPPAAGRSPASPPRPPLIRVHVCPRSGSTRAQQAVRLKAMGVVPAVEWPRTVAGKLLLQ